MSWNLCQQLQVSCWLDRATLFLWLCWNIFHQMKIYFLFWQWFFSLDFFQNPSNWLASNLGWLHSLQLSPPNLWGRPSRWTYSGQTAKQHLAELLDLWKNTRHSEDPEIFWSNPKKSAEGRCVKCPWQVGGCFCWKKVLMIRPPNGMDILWAVLLPWYDMHVHLQYVIQHENTMNLFLSWKF